MGRTNIVIDDEILERIMQRYGISTKTEAVDTALRYLAGRPMTRDEALEMRGASLIANIPTDDRPA